MKRIDIAKLLAYTPNVMAQKEEIIQFFYSPQFHPQEENEGNIIEDFRNFKGQLDSDLVYFKDWSLDKTHLSGSIVIKNTIPKKVQAKLDADSKELEDYIKNFDKE